MKRIFLSLVLTVTVAMLSSCSVLMSTDAKYDQVIEATATVLKSNDYKINLYRPELGFIEAHKGAVNCQVNFVKVGKGNIIVAYIKTDNDFVFNAISYDLRKLKLYNTEIKIVRLETET